MRAAKTAGGGRVRLECSGAHFLRSLCKLTHKGYGQYVKGDGDAFSDFLQLNYPHISNAGLSRADFSNRQDWTLEVSYELFTLLEPILDYEVKSLPDDPNVLRDSVLMQMECLYFEAYVHVGAIMWRVVFRELRGLTNSKGLELNPMALNRYKLLDPSPLTTRNSDPALEPNINKQAVRIVYQSLSFNLGHGLISIKIAADQKSSTKRWTEIWSGTC